MSARWGEMGRGGGGFRPTPSRMTGKGIFKILFSMSDSVEGFPPDTGPFHHHGGVGENRLRLIEGGSRPNSPQQLPRLQPSENPQ